MFIIKKVSLFCLLLQRLGSIVIDVSFFVLPSGLQGGEVFLLPPSAGCREDLCDLGCSFFFRVEPLFSCSYNPLNEDVNFVLVASGDLLEMVCEETVHGLLTFSGGFFPVIQ